MHTTHVIEEKVSGSKHDDAPSCNRSSTSCDQGDTLVVTRLDRLARSLEDLQDIVHELKAQGVVLRATEQPIDTGMAAGKAFLGYARRVGRVRERSSARSSLRVSPRRKMTAVVELRRHFPLIQDNEQARACVRTIVGWKPPVGEVAEITPARRATGDPVPAALSAPHVITYPDCDGAGPVLMRPSGSGCEELLTCHELPL